MKTHEVIQGTPMWLALKENYNSASEASAMMGCSKVMSRDDLLKYKATGQEREISKYTEEVIFPNGHRVEALARPFAEEFIGEKLYPVVGSSDDDTLLTSFDGLTMSEKISWECKQWNEAKAAIVRAGEVPEEDIWQVIQGQIVSRAEKALYTLTDGTEERTIHVWYTLGDTDEKRLLAGWKQFNEDRANYVYTPEPELIKAESVLSLPAVSIKVDGTIALIDNLDVFGEALKGYIERINKTPKTDQDFANLEAAVKTLKQAEDSLSAAENGALAQATDIDTMRRTVELYRSMARDNRLIFDKVVKTQKEVIKTGIFQDARDALVKHISLLNEGLGAQYVQYNADFKDVMKGKRTITTLRSAANDELARAKIEANEQAEKYRANLKTLNNTAADYKFLFNDLATIIGKEPGDFGLLVNDRVTKHKQAEAEKLEAERERIRKEEAAKLKAKQEAEQQEAERLQQETIEREEKARQDAAKKELDDRLEKERLARVAADIQNAIDQPTEPFPAVDRPDNAMPVYVIRVTDKQLAAQAIVAGSLNTDIDDLIINTDRLTERAYALNGNLTITGITVTVEKVA